MPVDRRPRSILDRILGVKDRTQYGSYSLFDDEDDNGALSGYGRFGPLGQQVTSPQQRGVLETLLGLPSDTASAPAPESRTAAPKLGIGAPDLRSLGISPSIVEAEQAERGDRKSRKRAFLGGLAALGPGIARIFTADTSAELQDALAETGAMQERYRMALEDQKERERERGFQLYRDILGQEAAAAEQEADRAHDARQRGLDRSLDSAQHTELLGEQRRQFDESYKLDERRTRATESSTEFDRERIGLERERIGLERQQIGLAREQNTYERLAGHEAAVGLLVARGLLSPDDAEAAMEESRLLGRPSGRLLTLSAEGQVLDRDLAKAETPMQQWKAINDSLTSRYALLTDINHIAPINPATGQPMTVTEFIGSQISDPALRQFVTSPPPSDLGINPSAPPPIQTTPEDVAGIAAKYRTLTAKELEEEAAELVEEGTDEAQIRTIFAQAFTGTDRAQEAKGAMERGIRGAKTRAAVSGAFKQNLGNFFNAIVEGTQPREERFFSPEQRAKRAEKRKAAEEKKRKSSKPDYGAAVREQFTRDEDDKADAARKRRERRRRAYERQYGE